MKKILVPVDFSKCSESALRTAASIARKTEAQILMLHLIDLPSGEIGFAKDGTPTGPAAILLMEDARKKFLEYKEKPYLRDLQVDDFLDFNKPFEGISDYAREHGVDLIVMGSHGAGKGSGFFVGSNTEKVVRTSRVPVLVIKKFVPDFAPKKVVFASSFKEKCHSCFRKIIGFIRIYEPELYLLRVNTEMNFMATHESEELINKFMEAHKDDYDPEKIHHVIYDDYSVQEGIFHFAHRIDADLIALSTHGRQGLWHFLQSSIAEDVVNKAKRNILTVKMD